MDVLRKVGLVSDASKASSGKESRDLETLQCIRGLNRDWADLGCENDKTTVPCANILEAMSRLSLPAATSVKRTMDPKVELGPARVASKPPTLILQRDADAQAACTKRCGIIGAVLGAALTSTALSCNVVSDMGVAKEQSEIVAQAGAAAASVVTVALCARLCEPGRKQKTFEAPGVGYKLKGEYVHTLQTKKEVDEFASYVATQHGKK